MTPVGDETWLHDLLVAALRTHGVPGGVLALHRDGRTATACAGVLHAGTGVPVTPGAVFALGSISKVYTATLVLQLADEGRLDLDAPVRDHLPDLRLADPDAAAAVTPRHLLTHTSGIEGDHLADYDDPFGRGDDCLAGHAASLAGARQLFPPGRHWSYSNNGYSLLGHLVERVAGGTFDMVLRDRVLAPLGATATGTLPEQALLHPVAVGHASAAPTPAPVTAWAEPRWVGPAGNVFASAGDVLAFVRAHLDRDGSLLSAATATTMQHQQAVVPRAAEHPDLGADGWGLGWKLQRWGDHTLIGHDGWVAGQRATLLAEPAAGWVLVLLTNSDDGHHVARQLLPRVLGEGLGLPVPAPLRPDPTVHPPLHRYVGTYAGNRQRYHVEALDSGLVVTGHGDGGQDGPHRLRPVDATTFVIDERRGPLGFLGGDGDRSGWLCHGWRLHVRETESAVRANW